MPALKERLSERVDRLRARSRPFDHLVRTVQHYSAVNGNLQAGAVTYFAFLSFFPVLALGFFAVGYISQVWPDARENLTTAIETVLPGIIGTGDGQIRLADIESAAGTLGLVGLAGVAYTGLGWLSAMREALGVLFAEPRADQPGFVSGKLRDVATLGVIGLVMVVSVALSSVLTRFSADLLDVVGLGRELSPLLAGLALVVGLAASAVLFFVLFRLLASPSVPKRSLWSGAVLGAAGFELLKQASAYLLSLTEGQPAFQAFGIALILVVWINYFSRVVMYAAAWAYVAPAARAHRADPSEEPQ